jgi:hypothetical protein
MIELKSKGIAALKALLRTDHLDARMGSGK